jgi:VanZ like family/Concanavalin A-like lectin/glucanases superfamily
MLLRAICAFVLFGILCAGLWPFHAPRNEVRWLSGGSRLLLGKYGSLVSAGSFHVNAHRAQSPCSLEIWLEPRRVESSGTILAFYWPESRVVPFALRQSLGDLELQYPTQGQPNPARKAKIYVDHALSHRKPVLITISSNEAGITVYADGAFVKRAAGFKLSSQDLTGQLIVGNSPVTTDNWSGQVRGLGVYDRELTAEQVSQHYVNWMKSEQLKLADRGARALYFFNEGNGNTVHNQVDAATDLVIPERFFVLHEQFLERPWDEYRRDWNYWKDVGINVAGFIPLGFFFYAYLSLVRRAEHPAALTIALGFAASLTIEVSQAFLPTRDSGMTDLITNTLGTALGVMAFRLQAVQRLLASAGLLLSQPTRQTLASRSVDSET